MKNKGVSAGYYELPRDATELKHLIWFRRMNAQMGEIFRSSYRYGEDHHSEPYRDLAKISAYSLQELERLFLYEDLDRETYHMVLNDIKEKVNTMLKNTRGIVDDPDETNH